MKPGKATNPAPTTHASSVLREWLSKEKKRLNNLMFFGQLEDIKKQEVYFCKGLDELLDQHDKMLKYCRIVVRCHKNFDFDENVKAIESYLVEELQIEP